MAGYIRLTPEFALVQALDTVPVLDKKVGALQPKKDWQPPFVFYIPTVDEEEKDLAGPCGLQSFQAQLHCVASSHRGLQSLCRRIKRALYEMPGTVYDTAEDGEETETGGRILAEDVDLTASSPDLIDMEVGYYRRIYTVKLDYQTEDVYEEEDSDDQD